MSYFLTLLDQRNKNESTKTIVDFDLSSLQGNNQLFSINCLAQMLSTKKYLKVKTVASSKFRLNDMSISEI